MRTACIGILWILLYLPAAADLAAELEELAAQGPGRQVSYLFVRSRDGTVLASGDPERLLVPASTHKILGAAVALRVLGPDGRLTTRLRCADEVLDGVLSGDLVLEGGWDPELSHEDLEDLARGLHAGGLRRVEGRLVVDAGTGTPFLGPGWSWEDAPYAFSPALSALVVDGGLLRVRLEPREAGGAPRVTAPEALSLSTRFAEGGVTWVRRPGHAETELVGTVSAPVEHWITDPFPARTVAQVFLTALEKAGIETSATVVHGPGSGGVLAEHESRPVGEMLRDGLARSDNLVLESLWQAAGRGTPAELPAGSFRMVDGCGLSRYDLISPDHLVALLRRRPEFRDLLPRPGEGTLHSRFRDSWGREHLRAKTGTMSTVSSLAGYIFPGEDREVVFAVMINGHLGPPEEAKELEERLVDHVALKIGWPYVLR